MLPPSIAALWSAWRRVICRVHRWKSDVRHGGLCLSSATIEDGGARSKALVAFYSRAYATRRACQSELTGADVADGIPLDLVYAIA
jgi:hypothetical protein